MDTYIITFFLMLLISFFFFIFNRKHNNKSINLPPGPPKLPIIGNLHRLAGALPQHALHDLSKKYGPIMHMQLGQHSTVIVTSPRLAKEVLKTNDIALASRPYSLLADIVLHKTSDVVFGSYGEYWRQLKKIITVELLSLKKVRSFGAFRKQEVDRFIDFVRSNCGKTITIHEKLMVMSNTVTCKASFGGKLKQQEVLLELVEILSDIAIGFHPEELFPDIWFLPILTGLKSKLINIHNSLDQIFDDIFNERRKIRTQRRAESGSVPDDDLLDVLFTIKEDGGLQFPITDGNIKAVFVNMFTGGTDTTAVTTEWAMTEMLRNPYTMDKAQNEVREKFHGKKIITEADLQELVYLKFIIKETLRLHPPLPLLVPRECREHCQIDGYDIPVKTKVIINAYACAIDPEYWDDPRSFKPERFQNSSIEFMGTNYEFIPFGAGRRICPGINFALASVEFTLAHMLYYFNWKLPSGMGPKDIDMTTDGGGIGKKEVPLKLVPTLYSSI